MFCVVCHDAAELESVHPRMILNLYLAVVSCQHTKVLMNAMLQPVLCIVHRSAARLTHKI